MYSVIASQSSLIDRLSLVVRGSRSVVYGEVPSKVCGDHYSFSACNELRDAHPNKFYFAHYVLKPTTTACDFFRDMACNFQDSQFDCHIAYLFKDSHCPSPSEVVRHELGGIRTGLSSWSV